VTEIMKLPKNLVKKFDEEYLKTKTKSVTNMTYASPSTKEYYSEMTKEIFGQSPEEMLSKLKIATKSVEKANANAERIKANAEKEKANAEKEKANAEKEKANAEKERIRSILLLYTKFGVSANDIATHLGYNLTYVQQIIDKNKPTKK
jgi:ribosomal protein L12E/L44/L45/RPP1/RPP2